MPQVNNEDAAYYFNLATEQYVEINLFFYLNKCEYSNFRALCVGIKNRHFICRIMLDQVEDVPIIWGTEVSGYFVVRDSELVYCHFHTRLARIYNGPPNALYLVFPLPRYIDHDQRRFSKRVTIDPEIATSFKIWHGTIDGGSSDTLPALRWITLENRHCEMADLSANGYRLDFPEKSPILEKFAVNDEMLLLGNFGLPRKPNNLYILGNIVRIMEKPESEGIVSVGCHFRSWRKVDTPPAQAWFRSDSKEGIGLVAQWVSRNFRTVAANKQPK